MIYVKANGKRTDRQLHYPLIEKGKKRHAILKKNVERLKALGMPEAEAKKALRG